MCNRKPFIWIKTFACKTIIHTVQGHRSKGLSTKAHCGTALAILTEGEYIILYILWITVPILGISLTEIWKCVHQKMKQKVLSNPISKGKTGTYPNAHQ